MLTACLVLAARAGAQPAPALAEDAVRLRESRLALKTVMDENARLKERLLIQENAVKALTESLAISNSESEMFKRESADLRLKIETLGVESVEGNRAKIEQRLLSAVRDLRLAKDANQALRAQLVRLSEATLTLLPAVQEVNPQTRLALETEIRRSNELLETADDASTKAPQPTLTEGAVIDVKEEIALVVANLGNRQGVRVGMPFQVWRNNERVGEVRVVDVRDRIAGAVVQNLSTPTEKIRVGDRLRVFTR